MFKQSARHHILIFLAVVVAATVEFVFVDLLLPLERKFSDKLVREYYSVPVADKDIVIIDIDEYSIGQMSSIVGRYPWPRSVYAEVIESLQQQQAKAVVFDILLTEPDLERPDADQYFIDTAVNSPITYFPYIRGTESDSEQAIPLNQFGSQLGFKLVNKAKSDVKATLLLPFENIALSGRIGTINYNRDEDGVGRRYDIYYPLGGWQLPSLPARVASSLGYPVPGKRSILLNWRGPYPAFQRVSFYDLYEDISRQNKKRPVNEFKDKIVVLGVTAAGLHDLRVTPISSLHPGVEIVATAIDNLKNNNYLTEVPIVTRLIITVVLTGLVLMIFIQQKQSIRRAGILLIILSFTLVAINYYALITDTLFSLLRVQIFLWLFFLLAGIYEYYQERRKKQQSIAMFSRFLDGRVVQHLVQQEQALDGLRKGETRQITVLFSDICGFTPLSEKHSAETIVSLLNQYFSKQVEVVFRHGGTLDKFIGDAIMAFWGAPVDDDRQTIRAVAAALDMIDALHEFREECGEIVKDFDIGIGIHTGDAVVGLIGSDNRLDYTAIGDTVNLASRVEGKTRGVANILVTEDVKQICGQEFDFIDKGYYKVKGKSAEVRLYEPKRIN